MVEPGAVFEIPGLLAEPPQAAYRFDPSPRKTRWVLVIAPLAHCVNPDQLTVTCVLLSAQTKYAADHDVLIFKGDAVVKDSIAQADLIFTLSKEDLLAARYRGTVLADTLKKVRAAVARFLEFV